MALKLQDIKEVIRILKESKSNDEICKAITCLRRNHVEKLSSYDENDLEKLCTILVKLGVSDDEKVNMEIWRTLDTVIPKIQNFDFLQLVAPMRKKRLKVFEYLAIQKDEIVAIISNKPSIISFLSDCLQFVQPKTMAWLSLENAENKELLKNADNRTLNPEQDFEEKIIEKTLNFLQKLYKMPSLNVEQLDSFIMSKIVPLAYMGQRKFRKLSLTILNQAIFNKLGDRVRANMKEKWEEYKNTLQNVYCKRMSLLVTECEQDWHIQWSTSIRFISTDLHKGSSIVNSLLKVEELAFKSSDVIRKQAFVSWKLLIENFSLDPQELASPRRIKLLCIPLNAKNCKNETLVLTKFEVWWHLIYKLHPNLQKFVDTILKPFLNFCFGPISDKPSFNQISDSNSAVAKKYPKAQFYVIDAFVQLLLEKKDQPKNKLQKLEEKLTESINQNVFQDMHKNFIYGFGEIVYILSSMSEQELEPKQNISKALWNCILKRITACDEKVKVSMYKEFVSVINELFKCNKVLIKVLLLDVILYDINTITSHLNHSDNNLAQIFLSFIHPDHFLYLNKNHCQSLEQLFGQVIKSKSSLYNPLTLEIVEKVVDILQEAKKNKSYTLMVCKIWCIASKTLKNYIEDSQNINEGRTLENNFKTIENFIEFPFSIADLDDESEVKNMANIWKGIYKQFDLQASLSITVKPNEILHKTCNMIMNWLEKNKNSLDFAILSSEILLETINYDHINADNILSFVELIKNLIIQTVPKSSFAIENILKTFSTFLLNVNSHDQNRVNTFLKLFEPAVKCMLTTSVEPDVEALIADSWSTIVNLIKNLHSRSILNYDLLSTYQTVIVQSISHLNLNINSQGLLILELTSNLDEKCKELLALIKNESSVISKNISIQDIKVQDKKEKNKPSKPAASYLNRKTMSPSIKTLTVSQNEKENIGKKKIFFEPDSQDFVAIDSNVKYDVNLLTDHQKELMKKRRDDIPALYNELSKSSSQDTQEIQKWFDNKLGKDNSKINMDSNVAKSRKSQINTEDKQSNGKSTSKVNGQKNDLLDEKKNAFESIRKSMEEKPIDQTDKNVQGTVQEKNVPTGKRRSKIQKFPSADQIQKKGTKRRISDPSSEEMSTSTSKRTRHSPEVLNSSGESNNSADESSLSKRQKNEMLRLQIDMVDFPPQLTGRRSATLKTNSQEEKSQESIKKRNRSSAKPENESKPIDIEIQTVNNQEKPTTTSHQETGKKRNRRSTKLHSDKDENKTVNIDSNKNQDSINTEVKSWKIHQEPDDLTQEIQIEEILTQERSPKTPEAQIESCDTFIISQDSDIVESSQEPTCMSKLDKMCKVKINKISSVQSEIVVGQNEDQEKEMNSIIKKVTSESDTNSDIKDSLESKKIDAVIKAPNTNSPKTSKPRKSFTMGRAAHMLGMVTKQSLAEKLESKDPEEITIIPLKKDKTPVVKDFDKTSTPCGGSRQEKIFNKMNNKNVKESCPSPSIKMFFNLRNDDDHVLQKLDKTLETTSSFEGESKNDQDIPEEFNENSPIPKKKELPILEWSTTNPDLTASPSASILKRHAQLLQEQDDTPNRKKRVSFADPAVSKEMCYHIDIDNDVTSPSRLNKLPSLTSPKTRKDLVLRSKRSKPLVIQLESENTDVKEQIIQIDQVEIIKKNDSNSLLINNKQGNVKEEQKLIPEVTTEKAKADNNITETQEDIFENIECINNSSTTITKIVEHNESTKNNSVTLDSIKLDSITISVSQKSYHHPTLEDTVDINNFTNLTSLNSTTNSEELFGKPMSTSTQQQFDQDTLPVTDSIFSNAPSSQDTQSSSLSMVHLPQPEALDSTLPIYPSLISCQDSIKPLTKELTNPLWTSHLTNLFSDRGIDSVGKLAQLSEREIERMPIKGSPKASQVKKVLSKYETSKNKDKSTPEKMTNVSSSTPIKDKSKSSENESKSKSLEKAKLNITFEEPIKQQNISSLDLGSPLRKRRQQVNISLQTSPAKKKYISNATEIDEMLDNCDLDVLLDRMMEKCSSQEILKKYKNKYESQLNNEIKKDVYSVLGVKLEEVSEPLKRFLLNVTDNFNETEFLESTFDLYKDKLSVDNIITLVKTLSKESLVEVISKAPNATQDALLEIIPDLISEKLSMSEKKEDVLNKVEGIFHKIPAKDCLNLFYKSMNDYLNK